MFRISYKKIIIIAVVVILVAANTPIFVQAASYVPLSGASTVKAVTGQNTGSINTGNLSQFLGQAFNLGIAVAVVLALIMIIWGGIEYMTTESFMGKSGAKERIQNAFLGLGLALLSYLLLYTINPCLVVFTATNGCQTSNQLVNNGQ